MKKVLKSFAILGCFVGFGMAAPVAEKPGVEKSIPNPKATMTMSTTPDEVDEKKEPVVNVEGKAEEAIIPAVSPEPSPVPTPAPVVKVKPTKAQPKRINLDKPSPKKISVPKIQ